MEPDLSRRGSSKRWLTQERSLLALSLVLLALCGLAAHWLVGSAQMPPPHDSNAREVFAAIVAVLSWVVGWTLLSISRERVVFEETPDGTYRPVPASKRKPR